MDNNKKSNIQGYLSGKGNYDNFYVDDIASFLAGFKGQCIDDVIEFLPMSKNDKSSFKCEVKRGKIVRYEVYNENNELIFKL
jgi:hypothetical protein